MQKTKHITQSHAVRCEYCRLRPEFSRVRVEVNRVNRAHLVHQLHCSNIVRSIARNVNARPSLVTRHSCNKFSFLIVWKHYLCIRIYVSSLSHHFPLFSPLPLLFFLPHNYLTFRTFPNFLTFLNFPILSASCIQPVPRSRVLINMASEKPNVEHVDNL